MSRFSKFSAFITAALATWVLLVPTRTGAQDAAVLFGTFNGAAKSVAVDTNGYLMVSAGAGSSFTSSVFQAPLTTLDGSTYTPILAGLGAGNLTNGVYSYKFTLSSTQGETEAGAATPTVTVVNAAANGQVTVRLPNTFNAGQATALNIYRTVAGGSVYKLVVALGYATFGTSEYTDNIADASLGVTAPTTNTSSGARLSVINESLTPPVSSYWGGYAYMFGVRDGKDVIFQTYNSVTRSGNGPDFRLLAGSSDTGIGGDVTFTGGFSFTGTGGAVQVFGGGADTGNGGNADIVGGSADGGTGSGGNATITAGNSFGGTGGNASVVAGDGATDGSVFLLGVAAYVKNVANNAYVTITASKFLGGGTTPAVSNTSANSCGTSAATIVGADIAGKVTVGATSGTSCTVTFSVAWANAPACFVMNETTANLARATSTTTTVILAGAFVAGDKLAYGCLGY